MEVVKKHTDIANINEIVAVMGMTGVGKSHLIRELTGDESIQVSDDIDSCTRDISMYEYTYGDRKIGLLDVPGFCDARIESQISLTDMHIFEQLMTFVSESFTQGKRLAGVIFLHDITQKRLDSSARQTLRRMEQFCGEKFLPHVGLMTNRWDMAQVEIDKSEKRERQLIEPSREFGALLSKGAQYSRLERIQEDVNCLLAKILQHPNPPTLPCTLKELLDDKGKTFNNTQMFNIIRRDSILMVNQATADLKNQNKDEAEKNKKQIDEFKEKTQLLDQELDCTLEESTDSNAVANFIDNAMKSLADSASEIAEKLKQESFDVESAVEKAIRSAKTKTSVAGMVCNIGGLVTSVALMVPEFAATFVVNMELILTIAKLRGYDVHSDYVQTQAKAAFLGMQIADLLKEVGIKVGTKLAKNAVQKHLTRTVIAKINRFIGFRFITKAGRTGIVNVLKWVPFVSGFIGGSINYLETRTCGNHAKKIFVTKSE